MQHRSSSASRKCRPGGPAAACASATGTRTACGKRPCTPAARIPAWRGRRRAHGYGAPFATNPRSAEPLTPPGLESAKAAAPGVPGAVPISPLPAEVQHAV